MAVQLKDFEFSQPTRPGRTSSFADNYPDWFNGKVWELTRDTKGPQDKQVSKEFPLSKDTDYRAKTESMLSILRGALKKMHSEDKSEFNSLHANVERDSLVIQAYFDEDKAKRQAAKAKAKDN